MTVFISVTYHREGCRGKPWVSEVDETRVMPSPGTSDREVDMLNKIALFLCIEV